jgi:hypothetical protein
MTFKPGQSGNPAGRPKGTRHRLSDSFLTAFCADFDEHGEAVIEKVRTEDPAAYLKAAVALMPKQVEIESRRFVARIPEKASSTEEWQSQNGTHTTQ